MSGDLELGETQDYDDYAFSQTQQVPSQPSKAKVQPLANLLWAYLVPASPGAGLERFDLRRDHMDKPYLFGRQSKVCSTDPAIPGLTSAVEMRLCIG
jgi:hypothetical protein